MQTVEKSVKSLKNEIFNFINGKNRQLFIDELDDCNVTIKNSKFYDEDGEVNNIQDLENILEFVQDRAKDTLANRKEFLELSNKIK